MARKNRIFTQTTRELVSLVLITCLGFAGLTYLLSLNEEDRIHFEKKYTEGVCFGKHPNYKKWNITCEE